MTLPSASIRLKYYATGFYAHVFLRDDVSDEWVYKVPAAYGYLLPFPTVMHKRRRPPIWKRSVVRLLGPTIWHPLMRWRRKRSFLEVLDILACIPADARNSLLPFRVENTISAVLVVDGHESRYCGPALLQLRVPLPTLEELLLHDPCAIIETQHRLWEVGIGLTERAQVVGTRGWAPLHGQLRIADTSHLSRSKLRVKAAVRPEVFSYQLGRMRRLLPAGPLLENAPLFVQRLQQGLNPGVVDRLWRSTLIPGQAN
jgi:hypothetical protein